MKPKILLRALTILTVSAALTSTSEVCFAQRGGHGGGGGFHGGGFHGGGFHGGGFGGFAGGVHGGRGFGNFHGSSGFAHYHGGFGGSYGYRGHGGYPFYFGINFGFGLGPYLGAYPYWYGYGPWWGPSAYYPYSPYYYPDTIDPSYRPDGRNSPDYRHDDVPPSSSNPDGDNAPTEPSSTPVPEASPDQDTVTTYSVMYRPLISRDRPNGSKHVGNNYQLAGSSAKQLSSGLRPAVRNAIQALRAMPPWAQQRWLDSGRYDNFTLQERKLLKDALRLPQGE